MYWADIFKKGTKRYSYLLKSVDVNPHNEYLISIANKTLSELGIDYGDNLIRKMKFINEKVPDFELYDMHGKRYNLAMLNSIPLVMHFGTTWCGSCQMDAEAYDSFAKEYKDKEIEFAHVFIGETPNSVCDYLKHYRSPMFSLIDYDYRVANKYNVVSYTTTFLLNPQGVNLFNNHDFFYDNNSTALRNIIDNLQLKTNENLRKSVCTPYSCVVTNHQKDTCTYEMAPRAVSDKNNLIWVTYYSNKDGNNNIYLRCYKNEKIINEYAITKYASDEYSPDIAITPDQTIWLTWISDLIGKYDIYACSLKNNTFSEPIQITQSYDDAFHPCITSDNKNNIHISYYKWSTLWNFSRDRDIYYKFYNGKNWSDEIRVSPTKPDFDDATDPSIVCDNNNNVFVAYSYDYHPGNGIYKKEELADLPTIFMQKIKENFDPNEQTFIGTKETVYKEVIDITPVLAVDTKNNIWCAWDALANETRYIFVKKATDNSEIVLSDKTAVSINPDIKFSDSDVPNIVWTQKKSDKWEIFGSKFENGFWTDPVKIVNSQSDCTEPVIIINKNKKDIVYVESQNNGSRIKLNEVKNY
jgi:thiol-disulfide isomerase/thioredoxin